MMAVGNNHLQELVDNYSWYVHCCLAVEDNCLTALADYYCLWLQLLPLKMLEDMRNAAAIVK
jgi:hypothetical protein